MIIDFTILAQKEIEANTEAEYEAQRNIIIRELEEQGWDVTVESEDEEDEE